MTQDKAKEIAKIGNLYIRSVQTVTGHQFFIGGLLTLN